MSADSAILDLPMRTVEEMAAELTSRVTAATTVRCHEPLARRTTLRVGGPADLFVEPASEEDLAVVLRFCGQHALEYFALGRGSNLLVRDGGFRGVVICLAHPWFSRVDVEGERLRCGAGAKLKQVSVEAKHHGLSGVEFLEGIPGSVGGALRMNAGAMGGATFEVLESVRYMDRDGNARDADARDIPFQYRSCDHFKTHIALEAVFKCRSASREEVKRKMDEFSHKRWDAQPAAPSAGCTFKNPAAIPAGRLIDELGLKDARVGGAVVSAEHGNFIINDGSATAKDVLDLIEMLKERVKAARGIELHTEVEIIGND